MKILILYQTPWLNATAYYGLTLAYGLKNEGHDVWFGTDRAAPACSAAEEKGITLFQINLNEKNPLGILREIKRLASFIKMEKIEIVNTLSPPGHLFHYLAKLFFGIRIPIVRSCCDERKPQANFINKLLYRKNVDSLVFTCKSNLERYRDILKFSKERAEVIYPAIDIEMFDKNKPPHELRSKFNIDQESQIVGHVARLSPEKGHKYFLEAASKVSKEIKNVHFVIVGKEEQISIDSLMKIAESFDIKDRVHFTGFYPDPRGIMEEFSVGVITSRFSETVSRAALEYFSSGKPVIATDVNILSEIIEPDYNGYFYDIDDVEGMAAGIVDLLKNEEKLRDFGKNARKSVEKNYNLSKFITDTLSLYNKVLNG